MDTNTNLEKMQKIVIMETLIKFKMIETWVNIIETLICIHIIQKIKEIIPIEVQKEKEEEGKEEQKEDKNTLGYMSNIISFPDLSSSIEGSKESMFDSYEILEHKYYEKMQQLVVKLKEEQTQLQFHLGSTQDAYEFELDIDLEATQYKMPITQESLLSLNDIFTKTKRFMKGDKKTWKENVTEFINKHFMNNLVDDIVTNSHYNSSNVMSIIQDQIPQLRFLNETNMKENFFSTIVEQEGKQYDDKTKTEFTKYYHHFFLENLYKHINTPEGLKELQNLLKEFQKLRDPEFYVEEKKETGEKEILEKIDMTYEPNLNLMRDFVKDNMKTKFEAYVKPNVEIKKEVVELKTERVEILIQEVSNKLEEQKVKVENKGKEIDEKIEALQRENVENNKKIKEMEEENQRLKEEKEKEHNVLEEANQRLTIDSKIKENELEANIKRLKEEKETEQHKLEAEKSNTLSQLEEEIRKNNIIKEQIEQLFVEKKRNRKYKTKNPTTRRRNWKIRNKIKKLTK